MPKTGYKRPGTTSALVYIPNPLHRQAVLWVDSEKRKGVNTSLQRLICEALEAYLARPSS